MVTIFLLRHGETAYNADGNRYCGRTDIDLTEKGILQAQRMRRLLERYDFDAVFCSPLKRAKQTAEIVSGREPSTILADPRLIEVDFGEWEGMRPSEFQEKNPQSWNNWLADPTKHRAGNTGETAEEVVSRLKMFYHELLEKYVGKTVLIVGHNGINRLFMAAELGMPLRNYRKIIQENSALTLLTLSKEEGLSLLKLNA